MFCVSVSNSTPPSSWAEGDTPCKLVNSVEERGGEGRGIFLIMSSSKAADRLAHVESKTPPTYHPSEHDAHSIPSHVLVVIAWR